MDGCDSHLEGISEMTKFMVKEGLCERVYMGLYYGIVDRYIEN